MRNLLCKCQGSQVFDIRVPFKMKEKRCCFSLIIAIVKAIYEFKDTSFMEWDNTLRLRCPGWTTEPEGIVQAQTR